MVIKKMILENFRQFNSEVFHFSNGINIVEGENGMGKSTFMASIIFCIHGFEELKKSELLENYDLLYNVNNIGQKSSKITKISLFIVIKGTNKEYEIIRTFDNTKLKEVGYNGSLEVLEILTHKKVVVSSDIIHTLLPVELVPLLFFNGEKIKSIESVISTPKKNSKDFKNQIENILKVNDYEAAKKLLSAANAEINNYRKENKVDDITKVVDKLDTSRRTIEIVQNRIDDMIYEIKSLDDKISEINKELKENEKSKEIQNKILEYEKQKHENNLKKKDLEEDLKESTPNEFIESIRRKIFTSITTSLKSEEIVGQIPGLDASAINYILENKKCVCGTTITLTEQEYLKNIKELIRPNEFISQLNGYISSNKDNRSIDRVKSDYISANQKEITYETEIKNLEEVIISFDGSDVSEMKQLQRKLNEKMEELLKKKDAERDKLAEAKVINSLAKSEYEKFSKSSEIIDQYDSAQRVIDKSIKEIEKRIKDKKNILQYKLQTEINKIANRLVRDDVEIKIDNNLKPSVKFISGTTAKSTGQNVQISIAYLFALMEVTKNDVDSFSNNKAVSYPLILDGITATLDKGHTFNTINDFYNYEGQVIFLTNSKEVDIVVHDLEKAGMENPKKGLQKLIREKNTNETRVERRNYEVY